MMPVELTGNLFKELKGRACRILSAEGWTQSNLGRALGVSQVMAGNYLHTLPTNYNEPIESNLQEAAVSLSEILKAGDSSRWTLKIVVDDQDLIINFPVQDSREKTLIKIAEMRKRLENVIPVLSPQVRANIAISSNDAIDSSGIAAFPGRLTPVGGKARPLSSPKFGASSHLSNLLLSLRNFDSQVSIIINLRWNSVISNLLNELEINSIKLTRKGDDLSIDEGFLGAEALIDEGGYGFEPSLYIVGQDQERVCRIVEDLASSMEAMA